MAKYYRQISSFLLFLSCCLVVYIAFETGLFHYTDLVAGEPANNREQEDQEIQIRRRERVLQEKESILKDQMTRYEKLIVELRTKLEAKEKDYSITLSSKEKECSTSLTNKDNEAKAKIAALEKDIKELRISKEEEVKKLQSKLAEFTDKKAGQYNVMYEKMESKKAAKILDEMDINLAASILESMKQERAAEIMSKMNPERARQITERAYPKRRTASQKVSSSAQPGAETNDNLALQNIPKGGE